MASNIIIFAVLACISTSVFASSIYKDQELDSIIDNLIDVAEKVLLSVSRAVDAALGEVARGIINTISALADFRDGFITQANQAIAKEVEIIHSVIETLKKLAAQESLLQCIEDNEDQIATIESGALETAVSCIHAAIEEVSDDAVDILHDIKLWNNDIAGQEQTLEECKSSNNAIECVSNVINRLVELVLSLPTRVQEDADKAQVNFDALGGVLQECAQTASNLMKEGREKLVKDVKQCIADNSTLIL